MVDITLEHLLRARPGYPSARTVAASAKLLGDDRLRRALEKRLPCPEPVEGPTPVLFVGFGLPGGAHGAGVQVQLDGVRYHHGWVISPEHAHAIEQNRALLAMGVACVPGVRKDEREAVFKAKSIRGRADPDLPRRLLRAEILDRGPGAVARTVAALAAHLAVDDDSQLVLQLPRPLDESTRHLAQVAPGLEPRTHDHWRLWRLAALLSALPPVLRARASFVVNAARPLPGVRLVLLQEPGPAPITEALPGWSAHVVRLADQDDAGPLAGFHEAAAALGRPTSAEDLAAVRRFLGGTREDRQRRERLATAVASASRASPGDIALRCTLAESFAAPPPNAADLWMELSDAWSLALWQMAVEDDALPARPTLAQLPLCITAYATVRAEIDAEAREAFAQAVVDALNEVTPEGLGAGSWQQATTAFRTRLFRLVDAGEVPPELLGAVLSALTDELRAGLRPGRKVEEVVGALLERGALDTDARASAVRLLVRQLHRRGGSLLGLLWSEHALEHAPEPYQALLHRAGEGPVPPVLAELADRIVALGEVPRFRDYARQGAHRALLDRLAAWLPTLDPRRGLPAYAAYMRADPATSAALRPGLVACLEEEAPTVADWLREEPDSVEALALCVVQAMPADDELTQRAAMAIDEIAATLGPAEGGALIEGIHHAEMQDRGLRTWDVLRRHWASR